MISGRVCFPGSQEKGRVAAEEEEELGLLWWSWFWLDTVRRGFLFSAPTPLSLFLLEIKSCKVALGGLIILTMQFRLASNFQQSSCLSHTQSLGVFLVGDHQKPCLAHPDRPAQSLGPEGQGAEPRGSKRPA